MQVQVPEVCSFLCQKVAHNAQAAYRRQCSGPQLFVAPVDVAATKAALGGSLSMLVLQVSRTSLATLATWMALTVQT